MTNMMDSFEKLMGIPRDKSTTMKDDVLPVLQPSNQTTRGVIAADDVTTIAFVAFASLCILATIVGNVLVVLSIFTYRPLRSVQNYYIVSLACADLAVAILVMPYNVADYVAGYWQFGPVFCNMWLTFDILVCTASILNLCAIAGDRFFAIHDPINYAQKRTLRRVLVVIAVVWGASAVISIPPLFGWNNSSSNSSSLYDEVNRSCKLTDEPGFVLYSASGSFYIPLAIMAFLYAKIYRATRERLRKRVSASLHPKSERTRRDTSDSPNSPAPPTPNRNGSLPLGKKCRNPLAKAVQEVKKNAEGLGELLESGKGVEEEEAGREGRQGKGKPEGEEGGACASDTADDGAVTCDRALLPPCDNNCKSIIDRHSNEIAEKSGEVTHGSTNGKSDNNRSSGESARNAGNGDGSTSDGNGTLDKGNGTVGDGSNKTGEEVRNSDDKRSINDATTDLATKAQQKSNGAPSKKTRCKTKNSLKTSSSLPRRGSRPLLAVSVLNRAKRSQSDNWTKTESYLRPAASSKPLRWSSKRGSPDSETVGRQVSQILENRQKISLSKERRAARTMAVVMGAFVLCWLPFFLMYVIFPFCESCRKNTDPRVKNFIVWLGYVNSMLNPVIYTIFNIDFRRAFKSLLQGNCRIVT